MADLPQLGKLEKVDLRQGWNHEALAFTPWLARPENLSILAETLGLELESRGTEVDVGPFRADLLCQDVREDRLVLVENQLEKTDHSHLGQILTYTAGLQDVGVIVWIAAFFTEEHRAALDWLNAATDTRYHFFGVEVELWKIGQSPPAPRFNVIAKPNEWSRNVSNSARIAASGELSGVGNKRLAYWTAFKEALDCHPYPKKLGKGFATHSRQFDTGIKPTISLACYVAKDSCGIFIRIKGEDRLSLYERLAQHQQEIEQRMGQPLEWKERAVWDSNICIITAWLKADTSLRDDWPRQHRFLCDALMNFDNALQEIFSEA